MKNLLKSASAFLLFLLLWIGTQPAQAHPHVWVTYYVDVASDKAGIEKLNFTWDFDAMFSEMALEAAGLKTVTPKDSRALEEKAFSNLKNYHYYTYITYDGHDFKPQEIEDFSALMKGKNLEYRFTIKLPQPAKNVEVTIWDEEFYVDLGPPTVEVPNDKIGDFMSERNFVAKPFVTTQGSGGAKPAACTQQKKERVNQIWGKFLTFIVDCTASS